MTRIPDTLEGAHGLLDGTELAHHLRVRDIKAIHQIVKSMEPFLNDHYGNPSSSHWAGKEAKEAYEKAREQVVALLGCDPEEVIFTSGGSEANNHALKGVYFALRARGNHLITTAIEHPAIMNPCNFLRKIGARVSYVGVDEDGLVDPAEIERQITGETIL